MFYLAKALLLTRVFTTSSHKETISSFGREFARDGILPRKLHEYLIEGQEDRLDADYDVFEDTSEDEANESLSHLEEFLDTTIHHLQETNQQL
jgi:uncharacterized protein (UPF0332 family)